MVDFTITDAETGEPVPDVSISTRPTDSDNAWQLQGVTDYKGKVRIFISDDEKKDWYYDLKFASKNSDYIQKDTTVRFSDSDLLEIKLQKAE